MAACILAIGLYDSRFSHAALLISTLVTPSAGAKQVKIQGPASFRSSGRQFHSGRVLLHSRRGERLTGNISEFGAENYRGHISNLPALPVTAPRLLETTFPVGWRAIAER